MFAPATAAWAPPTRAAAKVARARKMCRGTRNVLTGETAAKAGTIAAGSATRDPKEFLIIDSTAANFSSRLGTGKRSVLTNCIAVEAQDN